MIPKTNIANPRSKPGLPTRLSVLMLGLIMCMAGTLLALATAANWLIYASRLKVDPKFTSALREYAPPPELPWIFTVLICTLALSLVVKGFICSAKQVGLPGVFLAICATASLILILAWRYGPTAHLVTGSMVRTNPGSMQLPRGGSLSLGDSAIVVLPNGDPIELESCFTCRDPSWDELYKFLSRDLTDMHVYTYGQYVCANYAQDLCNNARREGFRCGVVALRLATMVGDAIAYERHALNIFHTTDRGDVYVDCTRPTNASGAQRAVYYLLDLRGSYLPEPLFPSNSSRVAPMGIVVHYDISW